MILAAKLLLLLVVANGMPVLLQLLLGHRLSAPIDHHRMLLDGRPLLGPSKTWRGLVAALITTPIIAKLLALPALVGIILGGGAMLGDLLSSFIKRRLGIPPSHPVLGLDQLPEALLPLLALWPLLTLDWAMVATVVVGFTAIELLLSRLLRPGRGR